MTRLPIDEERLEAALRAVYPDYELLDMGDRIDAQRRVEEALEASDAVLFAEENVSRSYPFVYSFLKRRGLVPVGKEVQSLVGYVVGVLKGDYSVE